MYGTVNQRHVGIPTLLRPTLQVTFVQTDVPLTVRLPSSLSETQVLVQVPYPGSSD